MNQNFHLCNELSSIPNDAPFQNSIVRTAVSWSLQYRCFATDADVKYGEAEFVGELIGEANLFIEYCPYCGQFLQQASSTLPSIENIKSAAADIIHTCINKFTVSKDGAECIILWEDTSWMIKQSKLATQKEFESGEADEVGETMWEVSLAVKFCPFCGILLQKLNGCH